MDDPALEDLTTPALARVAGGGLVATGLFGLAAALQLAALADGALAVASTGPLWLGAALLTVLGPFVYQGRGWAAVLAALAATGTVALGLAWTLWTLWSLVLAPALFLAVTAGLLAAPLAIGAVPGALRVSAARRAFAAF